MKKLQPLIYALLICSGILIGNIGNNPTEANEEGKINAILNLIDNHYVDTLNTSDFEDKTINAILKTASSTHNCSGATVYLTLSPCKECSKLVHQAGIKRLVFINKYKDTSGIDFLKEAGVEVVEFDKQKL